MSTQAPVSRVQTSDGYFAYVGAHIKVSKCNILAIQVKKNKIRAKRSYIHEVKMTLKVQTRFIIEDMYIISDE